MIQFRKKDPLEDPVRVERIRKYDYRVSKRFVI